MLQLNEQNRIPEMDHCYICGELALSGELRPVRGTLAVALEARKRRRERLIVPHQNAAEATVVDGLSVFGRDQPVRSRAILAGRERVSRGADAALDCSQNPRRIGLLRS
jgi:predicted ATPase with chaperone activity